MSDEYDSWLEGIGVTQFQPSDASDSMASGAKDLVSSGLSALGHVAKAGYDAAVAGTEAGLGSAQHLIAGGLDAVGAHGAATTYRDSANAWQDGAKTDYAAAGKELGQAGQAVFGGGGGGGSGETPEAPANPRSGAAAYKNKSKAPAPAKQAFRPMQPDCKPVHGKVRGPAHIQLCGTHGHVLNVKARMIIADTLDYYYVQQSVSPGYGVNLPSGGGGGYSSAQAGEAGGSQSADGAPSYSGGNGDPMQPDCKVVHGKCPGPKNHVLCGTHGHVLDTDAGTIIAGSVAEYTKLYGGGKATGGAGYGKATATPGYTDDEGSNSASAEGNVNSADRMGAGGFDDSSDSDDNSDPIPLTQSAQSGDIQSALETANLWKKQDEVAPLLNDAKVPENVKVTIVIVVDSNLNVNIVVNTDPNDKSGATLARLLNNKYSARMKKAIKDAGLTVTESLKVTWLTF